MSNRTVKQIKTEIEKYTGYMIKNQETIKTLETSLELAGLREENAELRNKLQGKLPLGK